MTDQGLGTQQWQHGMCLRVDTNLNHPRWQKKRKQLSQPTDFVTSRHNIMVLKERKSEVWPLTLMDVLVSISIPNSFIHFATFALLCRCWDHCRPIHSVQPSTSGTHTLSNRCVLRFCESFVCMYCWMASEATR